LPNLVVNLVLYTVIDEFADQAAGDRAYRGRRQQRWGEQTDRDADPAAPPRPFTAELIACLTDRNVPFAVVRDEDHAVDLDVAISDERYQTVEISPRSVDLLIAGDEYIGWCVRH